MTEDSVPLRLIKLSRQLTFWKLGTIFLTLMCVSVLATRSHAGPTRIDATAVVAHEFDLVNAAGRVTARLASDPANPDSPNLVLKYPNGNPAILVGIDSDSGASIGLLNSKGQPRALVTEHTNGPSLTLFDEADRIRIEVDALTAGPQISIYDKNRKRTVVAFSN
jgi:hypothetical protein